MSAGIQFQHGGINMENALIVSGEKSLPALASLLKGCGCSRLVTAANAGEARRKLLELSLDLVLINAPLPDEFGSELATSFADATMAGVVLVAPALQAAEIARPLERLGIFVLEKPISRSALTQAIRLLAVSRQRITQLQKKNAELLQKLDDTRLACRAKCLLVERLHLTEDEAHHCLERRAMDLRISRREAALTVIRQYESQND